MIGDLGGPRNSEGGSKHGPVTHEIESPNFKGAFQMPTTRHDDESGRITTCMTHVSNQRRNKYLYETSIVKPRQNPTGPSNMIHGKILFTRA